MRKCVVCSNCFLKTRHTRPDVIYHSFPKNEYKKRKWLKVYGIDHCYDWHRICSDHFLEEDYRKGRKRFLKPNAIPQPVDQTYDANGFPIDYTTHSNGDQIGNTTFFPTSPNNLRNLDYSDECDYLESEFYREEHTENSVVNNFESPRRSSRKIKLTTTNEDMSYENMPSLQTERFERKISNSNANDNNQTVIETVVQPMLTTTKDNSLGNGVRCSVKSCLNRYSKELSFFGYPNNFTLRKAWIEKCGLEGVDPTKKVKSSLKVCSVHFGDDCFVNLKKKKRLRHNAVPSLFLDDDITDERHIPSTSPHVNNEFFCIYRPSGSALKYLANVDNDFDPHFKNTNFKIYPSYKCCMPGCKTNADKVTLEDALFVPKIETLNKWSSRLGFQLTENSILCEKHFAIKQMFPPDFIVSRYVNKATSVVPDSLPVSNNVTVLRKYDGILNRPMDYNEHLFTQTSGNNESYNLCDEESNLYVVQNGEKSEIHYYSIKNDVNTYFAICQLNPSLEITYVPNNAINYATYNISKFKKPKNIQPKANRSLCFTPQSDGQSVSKPISTIDNTEEVSTYVDMPILKSRLTDNVNAFNVPPTTSDNRFQKTCPINLSDTSRNTTVEPENNSNVSEIKSDKLAKPVVDLSIVKIEPCDDVMSDSLQTNLEQTLPTTETDNFVHNNLQSSFTQYGQDWNITSEQTIPQSKVNPTFGSTPATQTIKTEPVVDNDDILPLISIGDSSSLSISNLEQKLKKISANSSLSITLEPVENSRVIKPSVDSSKSSMSITLQPKLDHNLSLTRNNSLPSVTLTHSLPSTSRSSVCNILPQSSMQNKQEAASSSKEPVKLSSNTKCPGFINDKIEILKPTSPTHKPNLSVLPEKKTPVIFNCISLAKESETQDFNLDYSTNTSQCTKAFKMKDSGFIYEISKSAILPSLFWTSVHDKCQNSTIFCQRDNFYKTVKKIIFHNSLIPTIHIYGKKYKFNKAIITKSELENLLEKIDNIEKCYGIDGFTHEKCVGYFENHSEDIEMCSACLGLVKGKVRDTVQDKIIFNDLTIESLKNTISGQQVEVSEARKRAQNKRKLEIYNSL